MKKLSARIWVCGENCLLITHIISHRLSKVEIIYPLFFNDQRNILFKEKATDLLLSIQNILGEFDATLNSSACEDIDMIDPRIRFSHVTNCRREDIDRALKRAFPWVLANMNNDGGFVFNRNESFYYGHEEIYSG